MFLNTPYSTFFIYLGARDQTQGFMHVKYTFYTELHIQNFIC
jgi:hypothetical protein